MVGLKYFTTENTFLIIIFADPIFHAAVVQCITVVVCFFYTRKTYGPEIARVYSFYAASPVCAAQRTINQCKTVTMEL